MNFKICTQHKPIITTPIHAAIPYPISNHLGIMVLFGMKRNNVLRPLRTNNIFFLVTFCFPVEIAIGLVFL